MGPLHPAAPEIIFSLALTCHSLIFNLISCLNILRCLNIVRFSSLNNYLDSHIHRVAVAGSLCVTAIWLSLLAFFKNDHLICPDGLFEYMTQKPRLNTGWSPANLIIGLTYFGTILCLNLGTHCYAEYQRKIGNLLLLSHHPFVTAPITEMTHQTLSFSRLGVIYLVSVTTIWGIVLFITKISIDMIPLVGLAMVTLWNVALPSYFLVISRKLRDCVQYHAVQLFRKLIVSRSQVHPQLSVETC